MIQPLRGQTLRAHDIETQVLQFLWGRGIERGELFLERRQGLIHQLADRPQGMVPRATRASRSMYTPTHR